MDRNVHLVISWSGDCVIIKAGKAYCLGVENLCIYWSQIAVSSGSTSVPSCSAHLFVGVYSAVLTKAKLGELYVWVTRQNADICVVWAGANQIDAGQAGTVALMC